MNRINTNQQTFRLSTALSFLFAIVIYVSSCSDKSILKDNLSSTCKPMSGNTPVVNKEDGRYQAYYTQSAIQIDGYDTDTIWSSLDWYSMNYRWMGASVDSSDYYGKFKLAWDKQHLYILAYIVDDHLLPTLKNGLENYWKGDYVEIFIDEDQSGGDHKFNHQAFAYHVSTEGHSIDKSTSQETAFYDDHILVQRSREGNIHVWEMAIQLYNDEFNENVITNTPVVITKNKTIGFSIAYGDNDGKNSRENFMGSKKSHGQNNDEGYINADVFGTVLFK